MMTAPQTVGYSGGYQPVPTQSPGQTVYVDPGAGGASAYSTGLLAQITPKVMSAYNPHHMFTWVTFALHAFLAFSAMAELTLKHFMDVRTWWILLVVAVALHVITGGFLGGLSCAGMQNTDHRPNHVWPFWQHLGANFVFDLILMLLLIVFEHNNDDIMSSFNSSRHNPAVTFTVHVIAAWYGFMVLFISAFVLRIVLQGETLNRHIHPLVKSIITPRDGDGAPAPMQ